MTLIKWLLILVLGAGTYRYITDPSGSIESGVLEDLRGYVGPQFMGCQKIGGQVQAGNEVMIFAPQNCSGDVAQRALRIAQSLKDKGIPVRFTNQTSLAFKEGSREALEQTAECSQRNMDQLMNREGPFVFINNHGKSKPRRNYGRLFGDEVRVGRLKIFG
jgi:hypothetical protein